MGRNKDYLYCLYLLCQGNIQIDVNQHKAYYEKAADYLRDKKFAGRISAEVYKDCVGKDQIIELTMLPSRTGDVVKLVGSDLRNVLFLACEEANEILQPRNFNWCRPQYDSTTHLEQLIAKCKASVHLTINEFKEKEFWDFDLGKYISDGTAKIYMNNLLIERPDVFDKDEGGGHEITPESRTIMEEKDVVMRLRWYVDTPISYNNLFDYDLPRMLAFADQETT